MNEPGKKPEWSIDHLNKELYDRKKKFHDINRRTIHDRDPEIKKDFDDVNPNAIAETLPKQKLPTSLFKKIFLFVLGFFLITVAVALVTLYEGGKQVSDDLIALELIGQPFVDSGEVLEFQVRVQNFNEQNLVLPDLTISYPKDSSIDAEEELARYALDDIEPNQRALESFDIVLFGQEGDTRTITAELEYRIEGSTAIFFKQVTHDVVIRSTPTELIVEAPETIVKNQIVDFEIELASNTLDPVTNGLLDITYPRGFELIEAQPEPRYFDNVWYLPSIAEDGAVIRFSGMLDALENQAQSFHFEFGKQNQEQKMSIETVFNALVHTIEITPSFLDIDLEIDRTNSPSVIVSGNELLSANFDYTNNLDVPLENVVIVAELSGNLYDPAEVVAQNGFYDSNNQTITWSGADLQDLRLLEPGATGRIMFSLKTRPLVEASGVLNNPEASISFNVTGIESGGIERSADNVSEVRLLASSDVQLITETNYQDGPIQNSGPIPPKVGQETTYTALISLANSSNDLREAQLSTILPSYVQWSGSVSPSTQRSNVSFNPQTRELVWDIGDIREGVGVSGNNPLQVAIQLEFTPSLSQVGDVVDLTQSLVFTAEDEFTNSIVEYRGPSFTTQLDDSGGSGTESRVVE